jgi:CBS domain-containing protein
MSVGEHCTRDLVTVRPGDSIRDVANQMEVRGAGCVVAVDDDGRPTGILTDRDIVLRVLRRGLDAETTTAAEVMGDELATVREATPLVTAMRRMRSHGVRRLPVVDAMGRLSGIFDWNDAIRIIDAELHQAAHVANAQRPRQEGA